MEARPVAEPLRKIVGYSVRLWEGDKCAKFCDGLLAVPPTKFKMDRPAGDLIRDFLENESGESPLDRVENSSVPYVPMKSGHLANLFENVEKMIVLYMFTHADSVAGPSPRVQYILAAGGSFLVETEVRADFDAAIGKILDGDYVERCALMVYTILMVCVMSATKQAHEIMEANARHLSYIAETDQARVELLRMVRHMIWVFVDPAGRALVRHRVYEEARKLVGFEWFRYETDAETDPPKYSDTHHFDDLVPSTSDQGGTANEALRDLKDIISRGYALSSSLLWSGPATLNLGAAENRFGYEEVRYIDATAAGGAKFSFGDRRPTRDHFHVCTVLYGPADQFREKCSQIFAPIVAGWFKGPWERWAAEKLLRKMVVSEFHRELVIANTMLYAQVYFGGRVYSDSLDLNMFLGSGTKKLLAITNVLVKSVGPGEPADKMIENTVLEYVANVAAELNVVRSDTFVNLIAANITRRARAVHEDPVLSHNDEWIPSSNKWYVYMDMMRELAKDGGKIAAKVASAYADMFADDSNRLLFVTDGHISAQEIFVDRLKKMLQK
jgi:hypothetical protein